MQKKPLRTKRQQEIEETREKLANLEALEEAAQKNPTVDLAEYLHDQICTYNHTDGCGWGYSSWADPCDTRKKYLDVAEQLMVLVGNDRKKAHEIVRLIGSI